MTLRASDALDLGDIANDLSEIASRLDTSVDPCVSCGREHWNDRDEYQLARSIDAAARKVAGLKSQAHGILKKRGEV